MDKGRDISNLVKKTFVEAIDNLSKDYQGGSLSAIFITVDKESGEVAFYDDDENRMADIVVFDWVNKQDKLEDEEIIRILRQVSEQLDNEDLYAPIELHKPFSINYADDSFTITEEILTVNDDSDINFDNNLMEKFDREFDDFLDKLLKE